MANVKLYTFFEVVDAGGVIQRGGSRYNPKTITAADGDTFDKTITLAATTATKIYDSTVDDLADFDFLWILSDTDDVMVQFTTDPGGANEKYWVKHLEADAPLVCGNDDVLDDSGSVDAFDGSGDVISEIWLYETAGGAVVRMFAIT